MINKNKCNNCLTGLLNVIDLCVCETCTEKFYLHDFVPQINTLWFDDLATEQYGSGSNLAKSLIQGAEQKLLSELDLVIPENYKIKSNYESICSTCSFTTLFNPSGQNVGQNVKVVFNSKMTYLKFTKISVKTDRTGASIFVIDDGVNVVSTVLNLVANTVQDFNIPEYITFEKNVKMYFQDNTIGLANILCPTNGGCGCCGGANNNSLSKWFVLSGFNGTATTTQQYGILPCIEVGCDAGSLKCTLASKYPQVMARYMAYEVAKQVYVMLLNATSKNETTINLDKDLIKESINILDSSLNKLMYGSEKAYGNSATKGIVQLLESGAKALSGSDMCVVCDSFSYTSKSVF